MGFYPEPPDPVPPGPWNRLPVWACPPYDVDPDVVPLELVLGFSDTAVVLLPSVRAFPTGLQIEMCLQLHHPGDDVGLFRELDESSPGVDPANVPGDAAWRAGRFTWGVQFADGRR